MNPALVSFGLYMVGVFALARDIIDPIDLG